jgi:hypothetical protein
VRDDRDVGVGGAQRVVAHDRLQRLAVPRLAHDRRQRVALAGEHLQDLSELGLDHQPPLVDRGLGVLAVADLGDQALARGQAADQAARERVIGVFEQAPDVAPG